MVRLTLAAVRRDLEREVETPQLLQPRDGVLPVPDALLHAARISRQDLNASLTDDAYYAAVPTFWFYTLSIFASHAACLALLATTPDGATPSIALLRPAPCGSAPAPPPQSPAPPPPPPSCNDGVGGAGAQQASSPALAAAIPPVCLEAPLPPAPPARDGGNSSGSGTTAAAAAEECTALHLTLSVLPFETSALAAEAVSCEHRAAVHTYLMHVDGCAPYPCAEGHDVAGVRPGVVAAWARLHAAARACLAASDFLTDGMTAGDGPPTRVPPPPPTALQRGALLPVAQAAVAAILGAASTVPELPPRIAHLLFHLFRRLFARDPSVGVGMTMDPPVQWHALLLRDNVEVPVEVAPRGGQATGEATGEEWVG